MTRALTMLPELLPTCVDVGTHFRTCRTRHGEDGIMHALRMLGSVGRIAEALATHRAGELLLGGAVHAGAEVRLQQVHVGEGFAAFVAAEGLLARVLLAVDFELLLGDEAEAAAGDVAGVWFVVGVAV